MTEAEWLACARARPLLSRQGGLVSDRKLRLFACACCRTLRSVERDSGLTFLLDGMEQHADGRVLLAELPRYGFGSDHLSRVIQGIKSGNAFSAAHKVVRELGPSESSFADRLRDIFGNPFRPVAFASEWRTDTAVTLARQMYESREFGAMPILADALQDAGCDSDDILDHCRSNGTHVRGCWVCDLVLEKE